MPLDNFWDNQGYPNKRSPGRRPLVKPPQRAQEIHNLIKEKFSTMNIPKPDLKKTLEENVSTKLCNQFLKGEQIAIKSNDKQRLWLY